MNNKIIHYCWFGGHEKGTLITRCIDSWSRLNPDCEIIEWNEHNIPNDIEFVNWCLKRKYWAFAADYIRYYVLDKYGGIYLDTDMELVSGLDGLFQLELFFGLESSTRVSNGVIGGIKGHELYKRIMRRLDERHQNKKQLVPITAICTDEILDFRGSIYPGDISKIMIFEEHVFYPYNPYDHGRSCNQLMFSDIKVDTIAIHHWSNSWKKSFFQRVYQKLRSLLGKI